ncbi:MAG TPA: signal peptidase I [Solirubrobacterales bacterium]|jgi:signal peptidase|nr:signal peptidase I [Solirubrobacterales bacterium]
MKAIRTAAVSLAAAVCLALGAVTLVPAALGLQHYVIVSGSMTGTYDRGSVVFDEQAPVAALQRGDVITYSPPAFAPAGHATGLVTHRIFSIDRAHGHAVYRTKGDANPAPDPWTFSLDQPRQAKVVAHVPYVGYALAALEIRWVRMLAIGVPALLLAISILAGMVAEARAERRLEDEALLQGSGQQI